MFLYDYIIKLLLGNTNTLFLGLIVVLFGYYGWMIYTLHKSFDAFLGEWKYYQQQIADIEDLLQKLDRTIYRDILEKIDGNATSLKQLTDKVEELGDMLEKSDVNTEAVIKEESEEIKEIIKILLSRSLDINKKKIRFSEIINGKEEQRSTENK
ncbi:MAG: hypothetical protein ACOCZ3_03355 [Bacillota bacterium]